MKSARLFVTLLFAVSAAQPAPAQSTFQNLNFESATLAPTTGSGGDVAIGAALPGWNGSIGGAPVSEVLQNNYTLGEASIDIFGPNYASVGQGFGFGQGVIDGNYTVFLQAFNPSQGNVAIWQNGTIPANAESVQFKAWSYGEGATFSVSFAGNTLSPVEISSVANDTGIPVIEYGANIGAYAGQTGELEFTANYGNQGASWSEFDDITFSNVSVTPEPNTLALIVMGGLALAARRRRAKAS
jgi:hypothetical protein